jgi:sulfur carrier protein
MSQELTLTCHDCARYAADTARRASPGHANGRPSGEDAPQGSLRKRAGFTPVLITLNGERFELDQRVSVTELLSKLEIDPRRVAVEHNLAILKRHTFPDVIVEDGDTVEIVNFVGGG